MKRLVGLALILFALGCIGGDEKPQAKGPICDGCNVILITVDALRADHMGLYGYGRDTTPSIDIFSEKAIVFDRAYAPSSWTRTSMASMLTSIDSPGHGVVDETTKSYLEGGFTTLQEAFQGDGYATAGYVTNSNLRASWGFSQGFDHFYDNISDWWAGKVLQNATRWMNAQDRPFFVWIHLNEPHDPYTPYKEFKNLYTKHEAGLIDPYKTSREWMDAERRHPNGTYMLSDRDFERMVALYDGELSYIDQEIKVLLYKLSMEEHTKDTIIIITSDHGEEFLDHGDLFHGQSLHDELEKIPLIIFVPNVVPKRVAYPVSLIDIYPTLADLTGIPAPSGNGISLLHTVPDRRVYAETDFRGHGLSMIIAGDKKIVHDRISNETVAYDLARDPGEMDPRKVVGVELEQALGSISKMRLQAYKTTGEARISDDTRESLKHLGYIV